MYEIPLYLAVSGCNIVFSFLKCSFFAQARISGICVLCITITMHLGLHLRDSIFYKYHTSVVTVCDMCLCFINFKIVTLN